MPFLLVIAADRPLSECGQCLYLDGVCPHGMYYDELYTDSIVVNVHARLDMLTTYQLSHHVSR